MFSSGALVPRAAAGVCASRRPRRAPGNGAAGVRRWLGRHLRAASPPLLAPGLAVSLGLRAYAQRHSPPHVAVRSRGCFSGRPPRLAPWRPLPGFPVPVVSFHLFGCRHSCWPRCFYRLRILLGGDARCVAPYALLPRPAWCTLFRRVLMLTRPHTTSRANCRIPCMNPIN